MPRTLAAKLDEAVRRVCPIQGVSIERRSAKPVHVNGCQRVAALEAGGSCVLDPSARFLDQPVNAFLKICKRASQMLRHSAPFDNEAVGSKLA